jgi:O-antigen/teichoic acid export membrane protein
LIKSLLINKERLNLLVSQIVIAIIGLLSGKIIALYFSPSDYGLFNLQFAIYTFFFTLLLSPFIQYMKTVSKTLLLKLGYKFFLYLAVILMLFFYLSLLIIYNINYGLNYMFFAVLLIMIPANLIFNLISDYFNVYNKLNLFSASNFTKNFVSLLFLIVLLTLNYKYNDGLVLLWIFQVVGFVFGILFFLPHYKFNFSQIYSISFKKFSSRYALYASPLVILAFWSWINNYFDRFAIENFLSINEVGIYNANYTVGAKFFLLLNPFFLTLLVPNVYKNNEIGIRKNTIYKYAKIYTLISIPILVVIYFLTDFIGLLLLSKKYESGFHLIFWIALSYFFLTLIYLFETIFYAESKTKIILYSNIISAILNILLNVFLIPIYGLNGAFIATLIAFIVRFLVVYLYFKKL